MMYTYVRFHLIETVLNAVGRHKVGYVQQSMLSRTRTDIDQMTLVLLRLCHEVCLSEVSSQCLFISEKLS